MPFRKIISVTKSLTTPAIARRAAALSTVVLAERLLVPAAAWSFFKHGLIAQIALAFATGSVFSGRTFVQHAFRAQTEVDLLDRVASRLIGGNVLQGSAVRDEDARTELGQAMYHAAQNVSVILPLLLADALATISLGTVVVLKEPLRLVGIAIATSIAAGAVLLTSRRPIEGAIAAAWTAQQEAFANFMDALEGRLEVVASGRRAAFVEQLHVRAAIWGKAGARVAVGALVSGKLPFLTVAAIVAVAMAIAGHGALGVTTADIALLAGMTPAFSGIAQDLFALARTERWMEVVAHALAEPPLDSGGSHAPPELPAALTFENVSFSYEGVPTPALREVTFAWRGERVLALTGPNGSGKSTCLRLLLALARPQSGVITVGGTSLEELRSDAWRQMVAFLPQRPYLPPHSSIRTAIRFLAPEATDGKMREALERVGLSFGLNRFTEDPLKVRVRALSIGERQRIGIARLLCQTASLILLDEPDANLDRAGVNLMAGLIGELAQHAMVALVAHSPELLDVADRVLVLDGGHLVADGAHRPATNRPFSSSPLRVPPNQSSNP